MRVREPPGLALWLLGKLGASYRDYPFDKPYTRK